MTSLENEFYRRLDRLLTRPDVAATIEKIGRRDELPIYRYN